MIKQVGLIACAISALVVTSCTSGGDKPEAASAAQVCASPVPFPGGFDYPQSAQTIQNWVAKRDIAAARQHGWNLFAGLQSDAGGQWVWRSWCTATQAFAGQAPPSGSPDAEGAEAAAATTHGQLPMKMFKQNNGPTTGADPINFTDVPQYPIPPQVLSNPKYKQCIQAPAKGAKLQTLAGGPQFQNNGDVMVAGVIYNDPAYQWIRNKSLYQTATLQGLLPPANQNREMAAMPSGSIVLKPMLWPIKQSGYTALPVWDDRKDDFGRYTGFEIQSQWPRAMAVTPQSASQIATVDVTFLHGVTTKAGGKLGPNTYKQARTVGIEQFYHFKPDLASLDPCDQAILDASAYYAYGQPFKQGDYLALIAMHIMTKEQPDWTFQSVWWSDRAGTGPYAADRPSNPAAKGPWRNYLMASTYGWRDVAQPANWPIAYNPYIELAAAHPIDTNCMNCHKRAAWPEGDNAGSYLRDGGPSALQAFRYQDQPIFNGLIGVDSLWSIADRVPPAASATPTSSPSAGPPLKPATR